METLHQFEIEIILFFQSLGAWLAGPMRLFSMLGYEEFFMLIMPSLYWCFDSILGMRMAVMLLLCNASNALFKLSLHSTRPYWLDPQVQAYTTESSFGLPSGHAQIAAGLWGVMAVSVKKIWAKIALVIVIFLIGLSRIYLGVHFVSDVILGWLLGGLLLLAYLKLERPVVDWLRGQSLKQHLALVVASTVLLILMVLIPRTALGAWQIPATWQENAFSDFPENVLDPLKIDVAFTFSGTWFGFFAGAAWLYHLQGMFDPSGTPRQRLLRYVLGIAGVLILWFGLGQIFPRDGTLLSYFLRFVRYSLLGGWVSAAAPMLFAQLGLTHNTKVTVAPLSAR